MDTELLDCLNRLGNAYANHMQRVETADLPTPRLVDTANAVLLARLDLYRCLIRQGWTPPPAIRAQIYADIDLLGLPHDPE